MSGPNGVPQGVLLDFGGVLVDVIHRPGGLREVASDVAGLLSRSHVNSLRRDRIERDVRAGWKAYRDWKSGDGRRAFPREIGHREFWADFVAADWPTKARSVVEEHAYALCERIDVATKDRPAKPDALETLKVLAARRIALAVVSNALCGSGSRALVRSYGFEPLLAAQVYSDEIGLRKPNPRIFAAAASAIGVDLAACWYVGDQIDRDVLGGRRAGVGLVILLPSRETGTGNDAVVEADAVIDSPKGLLSLLSSGSMTG